MSIIIGRKTEIQELERHYQSRIESLKEALSAKQTVHLTMVTTYGVTYGKHSGIIQKQVVMDDLFA